MHFSGEFIDNLKFSCVLVENLVLYMAPELVRSDGGLVILSGEKQLDGTKCDVYSAGIMFAEIADPQKILHEVRYHVLG